ncbi:MAG: phosphoribosyltransferase family protein [Candidatus Bathyarchaeota archaeon]|nr:phosphoribosyltransferase family protein [Candidatus Bathyarchaeota archaeon]
MSNIASKVAFALYNSGCLKFGTFKIKSGAISPYYIDLACLLSSPKDLGTIADAVAETIRRIIASEKVDKLASIELKGALILPSIASRVNLPCVVMRKEEKSYGVTGRIAGANVEKGESIIFFDDVLSEGLSKLEGIKPLKEMGAYIKHVVVVVDREQGGKQNLEKSGYAVHTLTSVSKMVDSLYKSGAVSKEQADAVLDYVKRHQLQVNEKFLQP